MTFADEADATVVTVVLDVVALLPPAAEAPSTGSVQPLGAAIATTASASTAPRPIARDPWARA